MKRIKNLFPQIICWSNLIKAARLARRGKRFRPNVLKFEFNHETELLRLQSALTSGTWRPGTFRSFPIRDPKPRLISAAPYRDRVVHHAVCNVVEPIFERRFIHDSYACRRNKGTHAAIDRAGYFSRRFPFVLKTDIRSYFPSIDHSFLIGQLARVLADRRVLNLFEVIIRHPFPGQRRSGFFGNDNLLTSLERTCGLPIGNQTSQFLSNVMLDPLDHFIKEHLRCHGYVRYSDDLLIFGRSADELHDMRNQVECRLTQMRLRLHRNKTQVFPVACGIPFLGFRVFPTHRRLSRRSTTRFKRRLRLMQQQCGHGQLTLNECSQRIRSWWAHAQHGDAFHWAAQVLSDHPFVSGNLHAVGASDSPIAR